MPGERPSELPEDLPDNVPDDFAEERPGPRRPKFGNPPPTRRPVHVLDAPTVEGRRVILMTPDGPLYDYRAASEVFSDDAGTWIKVVQEWRWYAWQEMPAATRPATCPRARAWSTTNVWVE